MSSKKVIGFVVFLGAMVSLFSQEPNFSTQKPDSELVIDGFSYPDFNDGSRYASFSIRYALTKTTEIGLFGYHYRNLIAERFRIPIQIKQYTGQKLYVVGGYEQEWDLRNENKGKPNGTPLQSIFYGMGYDIKPGLS